MRVRSLDQAATWIDEVGIALLFPNGEYVLPSLWEAVAGSPEVDWSIRDDDGKYVAFTPNMRKVWSWKDELPAARLACVGLHVARTTSLVAPRLVAALYAATEESRGEIDGLEREIVDAAESWAAPPAAASSGCWSAPRSATLTARSTPCSASSC
jgi:hypothetical protein